MIVFARRAPRIHRPSRSQKPGIVLGLRYERRLIAALRDAISGFANFRIENNPWFFWRDENGNTGACSPDTLLFDDDLQRIIVIEIKYTWVSAALPKLKDLYCPVVTAALGLPTVPLVIVKRLTPEAPKPGLGLLSAEETSLFQWPERGTIVF